MAVAVSPFSDGTPQASQWPIPPSHFFDYEINIPKELELISTTVTLDSKLFQRRGL
jgi:hypothetical protein